MRGDTARTVGRHARCHRSIRAAGLRQPPPPPIAIAYYYYLDGRFLDGAAHHTFRPRVATARAIYGPASTVGLEIVPTDGITSTGTARGDRISDECRRRTVASQRTERTTNGLAALTRTPTRSPISRVVDNWQPSVRVFFVGKLVRVTVARRKTLHDFYR